MSWNKSSNYNNMHGATKKIIIIYSTFTHPVNVTLQRHD